MSINLEKVTYVYGAKTPFEKTAIKDISLTIHEGEFVGIIGHTGSGKSTLVQHLNGLLRPTTGKVTVNDVNLADKSEAAKKMKHKVGMVFQYPEHQLFEETIAKDIAFGPKNLGCSDKETDRRVRESMAFVGLKYDVFAERSPFHLSGGQMRRVAIAGVIALEPDYLILDEPSAGLDPFGREEIFEKIIKLHKEKGKTVVLVSHNMEDIARMANRLIVMDKGQVLLDGDPLDIFNNYHEQLTEAGVDVPPVSILVEHLRKKGLNASPNVLSVDDAVSSIYKAIKEGQNNA